MSKEKELLKIKTYLETSLTFLSNALWLDPCKAGTLVAECSAEACKNVYGNANGSIKNLRTDWMLSFKEGFTNKLSELINE